MGSPEDEGGEQKPGQCDQLQALIRQESAALNKDLAQKLASGVRIGIAEVLNAKGRRCKY